MGLHSRVATSTRSEARLLRRNPRNVRDLVLDPKCRESEDYSDEIRENMPG